MNVLIDVLYEQKTKSKRTLANKSEPRTLPVKIPLTVPEQNKKKYREKKTFRRWETAVGNNNGTRELVISLNKLIEP